MPDDEVALAASTGGVDDSLWSVGSTIVAKSVMTGHDSVRREGNDADDCRNHVPRRFRHPLPSRNHNKSVPRPTHRHFVTRSLVALPWHDGACRRHVLPAEQSTAPTLLTPPVPSQFFPSTLPSSLKVQHLVPDSTHPNREGPFLPAFLPPRRPARLPTNL